MAKLEKSFTVNKPGGSDALGISLNFTNMKKFTFILLLLLSIAAHSQTLPDYKENQYFAVNYMGYSRYIVSGYYGQITNFTDQVLTIQIDWTSGTKTVTVDPFELLSFDLDAPQYVINSHITFTIVDEKQNSKLICKIKGQCE